MHVSRTIWIWVAVGIREIDGVTNLATLYGTDVESETRAAAMTRAARKFAEGCPGHSMVFHDAGPCEMTVHAPDSDYPGGLVVVE